MRVSSAELLFFTLTSLSSALQVTPNSPCSTQCIDNSNENPSDPNSSNTYATDITCNNADYGTTTVGQKFQSCLSCLQNSAYSNGAENDQSWFLYNLRYALGTCLYGYPSNSTGIGGPCITPFACGSLSTAIQSGLDDPSGESTYGYCSADSDAFLGQYLTPCTTCLTGESDTSYLSNFVVALQAGCEQQDPTGTVIGLNETVFTSTLVAITTPSAPTSTASPGSSGLSTGAKAGIAIGGIVFVLLVVAICLIQWKKSQRRAFLKSRHHPRFGAIEISAPNLGGFVKSSCQKPATLATLNKYKPTVYDGYETPSSLGEHEHKPNFRDSNDFSPRSGSQPSTPPYNEASIPVHKAYIQPNKQETPVPISYDSHTPPNSAPTHTRVYSNSSNGTSPPNSASIRTTRNFSTPTGTGSYTGRDSLLVGSTTSPVATYNPSTYVPRFETGLAQAQQRQQNTANPSITTRHTPGRSQGWNTESAHSVELWPGSM